MEAYQTRRIPLADVFKMSKVTGKTDIKTSLMIINNLKEAGHIPGNPRLTKVHQGGMPLKVYKRGKEHYTVNDLVYGLQPIHRKLAIERLRAWEKGKISTKELLTPPKTREDMEGDWRDLGLGPRRSIDDIPISEFEREWGEAKEVKWGRTISAEYL